MVSAVDPLWPQSRFSGLDFTTKLAQSTSLDHSHKHSHKVLLSIINGNNRKILKFSLQNSVSPPSKIFFINISWGGVTTGPLDVSLYLVHCTSHR
jgi:hypothetical protein